MKRPKPSPLLIDILAPDPFDAGSLLLAAVDAHCARTGATHEAIGRAAGIDKGNLSRALRNPDARPGTVRAVCRALGLRVALVPVATACARRAARYERCGACNSCIQGAPCEEPVEAEG